MARNLFGPMGVFSTPNDANQAQTAPLQSGQPAKPDVGTVAQKYRIPRNILMAFEERGDDPEEAARKITAELDAGKAFQDIVPKAVRIRASDIADAIEGVQPEGGFGKAIGVGVDTIQQSLGSAVEGLGRSTGIEGLQTYGARVAEDNAAEAASGARGLTGLGDITGIGSAASYVSELAGQQAPQMGVSLAGAGAGALAGSAFGPVGTVVGGIAGGLASSIPLFYGQNRERQKEAMAAEGVPVQVDEGAAFLTSLPQAGLDTFSNLLAASGVGIGAKVLAQGGGVLTKRVMLQAAGEGAKRGIIAEVPTEIGQAVLERAQAGLPLFDEEAIREYIDNGVAAGILGGGLGAGGGVMDVRSEANKPAPAVPADDPAAPAGPLLLPSPTSGGTIFGQPPANTNPGADGSGVGQGAAPGMAPPGATGAAPVEPMGVLGRAAQAAPDLTPQPQAAPLFPDMKPGAKIVLADPATGEVIDATFQREENGIPIVRINGVEQPIPPQMFDIAVNAGQKAVEQAKADGKGGLAKAATPKAPRPAAPEPDLNALTLEQAQARLTDLDEKIRLAAKPSKKMIETRARLIDVVDRKQGEANAAIQPDGGAGIAPVGPVQGSDAAGSGPDPVAPVQESGLPNAPAPRGAEGVAGPAAGAQQGEALTQGAPSRVLGQNPVERSQREQEQKRARLAEIEAGLTEDQRAAVARIVDQAPEPDRWAARRGALSAFVGEAEPLLQPTSKDDTRALRAAQKAAQASQPAATRAPAAPITTPPAERIQPDMLGGQAVTEEDMATKERRKREWGKFLAIAEGGKYEDDMEIEGRDVLIRPGRVVIRAKKGEKSDLDYRLDTAGMARDDIATAMRGALRELDRVSPLPAAEPRPAAPAPVTQQDSYVATSENFPFADSMAGNPGPQAKRWLSAASDETILATPDRGLSENWLRAERKRRKIGEWAEKQPKPRDFAADVKAQGNLKNGMRVEYTAKGPFKKADGTLVDEEVRVGTITRIDRKNGQGTVEVLVDGGVNGKGYDVSIGASQLRPASEKPAIQEKIEAAAAETDPNPTPAQAEAENYKTGKVEWNGLTLSIENAKGSTRRKVGPDGETAWEVVMPAHYGRILGTKGADGDHVDFYMGDNPDSDMVWIIDQMDAETGLFDEHKAMLGFTDAMDVSEIYEAGFSDGKGKQRLGGIRKKTVAEFKAWLDSGILNEPLTPKARQADSNARAKSKDGTAGGKITVTQPRTGKTMEIDPLGPLRPGYERVMVDGKPSTDTTRMTEDGYVVRRNVRTTTITGPEGRIIYTGSYAVDEAVVEERIAEARQRRQADQPSVPVADDRREARKRQVRANGKQAALENMPRTAPDWLKGDDELVDLWMAGYGDGIAERGQASEPEAGVAADAPKPATGILSVLSEDKQKRADELKAKLAAKARNQVSSGVDPEYLTLGGELVALYVEAGVKKFGQMLRDFAESTGLTMRQAQAPMRVAYNHVRDTMDLDGEDVSDFDTADQVMAEIRKAIAEEAEAGKSPISQEATQDGNVAATTTEGDANDVPAGTDRTGEIGEGRERENGRDRGVISGQPGGNRDEGNVAGEQAADVQGDGGAGRSGRPRARRRGADDEAGGSARAGGLEPVGREDGSLPRTDDAGRLTPPTRQNYVITDPEALFGGTPKRRFAKNRAAIEAFQRVTDENREPTPEELEAMAAYIGWGSFGQELFQGSWDRPVYRDGWREENDWLRSHLGQEEWKAAQNSIINAHYTDPPTVQAMWRMAEQMGFKGGRVLEPSMGIGNFFGMMPAHLAQNSDLTGIELDRLTGGMAKLLYPRANVQIMGYEQNRTPDNFYDLVIGNWPFADFEVPDRRYMKLQPNLHDYFFVKALDQVRPGGIVMGITSAGTMDKQGRVIRNHLAKNAELVASFRLPSGAFEKYAGTAVVTDLIILRKREAPILDVSDAGWVKTEMVNTPAGTDIRVNEYYAANRDKVLGTLNFGSGTTYGRAAMIVDRPADLMERLQTLHEQLPADGYRPIVRGNEPRFVANNTTDPQKSVVERDGDLYQVQGDRLVRLEDIAKYKVKDAKGTAEREAQFRGLIDLRKKLGAVLDADRDGLPDADTKRAALKKAYQAFVKAHGRLRDTYALKLMDGKLGDPGAAKIKALETKDGKPAAIMERATTRAIRSLDNPTVADAFILARNETTILNLDRIAEIAKAPRDEVVARLLEAKAIYRTPGGGYEASDVYLAGNVRQKLKDAVAARDAGEDMEASVEALKGVLPPDVPYFNIEAKLGAMWIPSDVYREYLGERFGLPQTARDDISVRYSAGAWRVEFPQGFDGRAEVQAITGGEVRPKQFISYALNNQTITIRKRDIDGNEYKDDAASERANQLASELRQNFAEWVWQDPERRSNLETAYNDAMNAIATPSYDGSFMDFAGMALTRGDQPFNLRSHQSNAIWRGVLNGRGIYAHEVGTGKTITMAGLAVESRRYGVARKPLIIAHNANSRSVFNEIQDTYPGGKFLYVDNLAPAEIAETLNMIATDDWDGIVIPHSLIDRMALKEETLMAMAADEIAQYEQEALSAAREENAHLTLEMMDDEEAMKKVRSVTAKQLVKARNQIIAKIKKQALQASKENAVTFEELGVDMLVIDESHSFKKPPVATRMTVRGLQKEVSSRSLQLRFLTDFVKGQRGGKGVHVFTGTPITNTLTEIYHQMRYVMDDVMRQADVNEWDGFFNTFAASVPDVELTAAGDYESVERLSSFVNVAELRRMAGQYMDIVFADDMPEFKPRATKSGKTADAKDLTESERDELLNGRTEQPIGRPYKKVIHDIAEMDRVQRRILDEVVGHARAFRAASGKERISIMREGGPDAPIVFNNVPTRAGLDVRLHEMDAPDSPLSKASRAVRNVSRIYKEDPRTTQVIFMDEGYSDASTKAIKNADGEKTGTQKIARFNLAKDIRDRLIAEGIPADQIAIVDGPVTKEKRAEIAQKMNRLEIRVVIGQTQTLGVGVNMQENLRAMHHLDAPWMPGDLEQRNGRGHRQGNKWNTVLEYRYLTEGLDGRRWQVLAIKDRFIKAFLKADANLRVIEGDATDDATSMGADDLAQTLSEAAGDPRIFQAKKLEKDIDRLQRRERIHGEGIADAKRSIRRLEEQIPLTRARIEKLRRDQAKYEAARETGFTATIGGQTYDDRAAAQEAFDAVVMRMKTTDRDRYNYREFSEIGVSVQGFPIKARRLSYDEFTFAIEHEGWDGYDTMGKPSVASAEAGLRRFAGMIESREAGVAQNETSIARLKAATEQPFQQADILKAKQKQLSDLQADMKANPVAPPSWLRQGAPIDALIYVDGEPRAVTGHRWTDEGWFVLTEQGQVPYMDAMDEAGMPIYDERPFQPPEVSEGARLRTGDETNDSTPEDDAMEMRGEPVATLTGDELGEWGDILQLGKKAEAWYRNNLVGTTVTMESTGWPIQFGRVGAKKVSGRKGDILLRIVPALPEIIRNAQLVESTSGRKAGTERQTFHKVEANVSLAGIEYPVIVTIREDGNGKFHYDLSMSNAVSSGAADRVTEARSGQPDDNGNGDRNKSEARQGEAQLRDPALEGVPADLNLEFAPSSRKADPEVQEDDLRALTKALNGMPEMRGLEGRVTVKAVRRLVSHVTGNDILGRFTARDGIEVRAGRGAIGVMRHEIIHALRSEKLWNAPYGLFSGPEWRELVRAARAEPEIVRSVMARYKDQPPALQAEEMVAELYRLWAGQRDQYGAVARSLMKIEGFLRALANALRGRGFVDAGRTMDQIASGRIGGRGPDGSGGGRLRGGTDAEMRENLNPWNAQVFDALTGKIPENATLTLGPVPEIMRSLGAAGNRLVIAASKLRKIRSEHPEVTVDALSKLPQLLANPVFVLDNSGDQRTGDRLFVTDMVLGGDTVLVASIKRHGRDSEGGKATVVVTAYGKDQFTAMMKAADERGNVLYVRGEREGSGYKHTGANSLNAPLSGTMSTLRARSKILTPRAVFKLGKPEAGADMEMRALTGTVRDKFKPLVGFTNWSSPSQFLSDALTNAMANGRWSVLGLVPGRPLFTELAKKLPSAKKFVAAKDKMDAERSEWHVRTADVIDKWSDAHKKMPREIEAMHDLMFRVTISGIDPRKPDTWEADNPDVAKARAEVEKNGDRASAKAKQRVAQANDRAKTHAMVKAEFDALPQEAKDIFSAALKELSDLDKEGLKALEKSIRDQAQVALMNAEKEYRREVARIGDQGIVGKEADDLTAKAKAKLEAAQARASGAKMEGAISSLRQQFETARLKGPYFPLFRSGKFFVAARGPDGTLLSFVMMDTVQQQRATQRELQDKFPDAKVTSGLSADRDALREVVDARFVADIESMLADAGASEGLMDAVWQRYLQTMPEQSLRTNALHRKAVPGFNKDALRAFANHMFHGAHQTMRLKYSAELEKAIIEATDQAAIAEDRNRAEAVVQEMARRKEWILAPTNAPWVSWASGLTFIWYLGVSPAAALVNLSQTTIIGPAVMKAKFKGSTVPRILRELTRASQDFMRGQGNMWKDTWTAENAPGLTEDERAAIREGYRKGIIEKTQGHDNAGVAESGVQYHSTREKWMRAFGWAYHHAERFNREITFLAAYRMARDEGLEFDAAFEKARDITWDTHYSYTNSDRPRFMQGDFEKVLFAFKQFSVNLIWRLWRDTHQSLNGATAEDRAEARTQLIGITLSMFAHAGIKGVWGYGMIMALLALFLPGDREDHEEWLERALIKEGDDVGTAAWNFIMGSALNGVPGQLTGISLSERIGSPDLWFRTPSSDLEGDDLAFHYMQQLAGPTLGIGVSAFKAGSLLSDGEVVRGIEAATPKFLRDVIKTGRYATDGVTTMKGDQIVEDLNPWELFTQFNGFTPARLDEAFENRNYLYLVQDRIETERRSLHRKATDALVEGQAIPQDVLDQVAEFNRKYPFFKVDGESIRRSFRSRVQASERTEGGVNLNPKLDAYLRDLLAGEYR